MIEHAIDVAVRICCPELLCQRHRLIERDLRRDVDTLHQLKSPKTKEVPLYAVKRFNLSIKKRDVKCIKVQRTLGNTDEQLIEVFDIDIRKVIIGAKLCLD